MIEVREENVDLSDIDSSMEYDDSADDDSEKITFKSGWVLKL